MVLGVVVAVLMIAGGANGRAQIYDVDVKGRTIRLISPEHDTLAQVKKARLAEQQAREGAHLVQRMKASNGTVYDCLLPVEEAFPPREHLFESEKQRLEMESTVAFEMAADGPDRIGEALGTRCLVLETGWWTYEYCHNRHIRQYHYDPRTDLLQPNSTYYLGRNEITQRTNQPQQLAYYLRGETVTHENGTVTRSNEGLHIDAVYKNGDICQETGKPRTTTVKFKCLSLEDYPSFAVLKAPQKEVVPHVMFIDEVSLCSYVLVIGLQEFCKLLEPLREKVHVKDERHVPCFPV